MSQTQPLLGQLPGPDDKRDAIHIAIAPVVAAQVLAPGTRVSQLPDGRFVADSVSPIGIVDPFLLLRVNEGETFWLCLFPYSITSLRHVWTHPTFKAQAPGKES